MNRDVFLSLLALDAYNRSYGQTLNDLEVPNFDTNGQPLQNVRIGNARIISDSSLLGETADGRIDEAAGFYAIAYEWNNNGINETVISYRGTNFPDLSNLTSEAAEAAWDDSSARNASLAC
ncbi:hypothetical protein C0V72_01795 [Porphyrobacter sp. TH134]|uniref:hypothetical protein n=1 Tax=Porphyrobacter sp. TH134 TaxID=2067450 RepID=UPI000C7AC1A0|nr:hypothetical protein [Porphyrobacter sp. TH134]PLK25386.1 hypothetical protein C0V72_01795 [Porphyrobacter sp. TH134]